MLQSSSNDTFSEHLIQITSSGENIRDLLETPKDVERHLKKLEDFLTSKIVHLAVTTEEYGRLVAYIRCFGSLDSTLRTKLFNVIASGAGRAAKSFTDGQITRSALEAIIILCYAVILASEKNSIPTMAGTTKKTKDNTEVLYMKITIVEALRAWSLSSQFARLFESTAEMEPVVGVMVKITHTLLENNENCKHGNLTSLAMEVIASCAINLNYKMGLQTIILQDLNYLEHLSEINGEILFKIYSYRGDSTLVDSILGHLGTLKFTSSEDASMIKSTCRFLMRLTVLSPKLILKNITSLTDLMESEAYSLRMAMLEVYAILITHCLLQEDRTETSKTQALSFLALIEERLRDTSSFVRAKVLQVLATLVSANALPIMERTRLIEVVRGRILDKSSNVRKRAIQMLGELVKHHPFCVDGGELTLSMFEERLAEINDRINKMVPADVKETMGLDVVEEGSQMHEGEPTIVDSELLQNLLMQRRYYGDAVAFAKQLEKAFPSLIQLLSSNLKTEVFETMDFFVDAHIYGIEASLSGVNKMKHLIWEQDLSTEDGTKRSIKEHVLLCYRRIYLDVDARLTGRDQIVTVTRNLLQMVQGATPSDLASIEQILAGFLKKGWISTAVIESICATCFSSSSSTTNVDGRRRAFAILAMLARQQPEIILERMDLVVKHGLGSIACSDPVIFGQACLALRQCTQLRFSGESILFTRLRQIIMSAPCSPSWLQAISEAMRTTYTLCDKPSQVSASILAALGRETSASVRKKTMFVKLIFLVGEIASNEVANLHSIEAHYRQNRKKEETENILDAMKGITATDEDEFTEGLRYVREVELLYGEDSLLKRLVPLIISICTRNDIQDELILNTSSLTLGKLMAVSGRFCDEHLPLFLTLLERSPSPIIRSNLTIAFADIAQSFARIIDVNISYLFRRLSDERVEVRRNALLVLTHLTLTGMIKVKGQVGAIAKCILDQDAGMAALARLFFHELAGKEQGATTLYNHIPDLISSLTDGNDTTPVKEEEFRQISRFIFDYIKRERQMEGLLEKLIQRLRQTQDMRQARDLSYCLTLINFTSDRAARVLVDRFAMYRDKLVDPQVLVNISETVTRAIKAIKSTEIIAALEDLRKRIIEASGNDYDGAEQPIVAKSRNSRKGRRSKQSPHSDESDDEEAGDDDNNNMSDGNMSGDDHILNSSPVKAAKQKTSTKEKSTNARKTMITATDDEIKEEDLF